LKKVSGKKQRDAAAEEKLRQEAKASAEKKEREVEEATDAQDLLGDKDNEDVIF